MRRSLAAMIITALVSMEPSSDTFVNAFCSFSHLSLNTASCRSIATRSFTERLPVALAASQGTKTLSSNNQGTAKPQDDAINYETVNALTFRELQKECTGRGLNAAGRTAVLRSRLLEHFQIENTAAGGNNDIAALSDEECGLPDDITFSDESDPQFEFNIILKDVMSKASIGHWKAATRRLKKLNKCYATPENPVPAHAYVAVLQSCVVDRLHGARASEPARKIIEEMVDRGYDIPADIGNQCVLHCLGLGPNGTHEGFGGIDPALAMLAAMESYPRGSEIITITTYGAVVSALARDEAVEEAVLLLRSMVVEHSFTPPLSSFVDVAEAAAKAGTKGEIVLQVLTLAKAAGYVLDSIASAEAGRSLLASGVIAAEQMGNLALGLKFLAAAGKAEGCAPDTGDDLVASSSSAAQRASTLIHKRAIDKAVEDKNWKLACKLLELMLTRSLTPSASVWRKVVVICSKCEKSKKATACLLDWVRLSEEGQIEKPPINVFNTVMNTCEICGEEELTLLVLESMKKTHQTDGNLITFNIALKRLAKLGKVDSCEGIIVGMLQAGVEPNVVSYTTAIGACVKAMDSALAFEWLKRMRSRNVKPNFHTYNTALAACLDGKLESTVLGSTIATEILIDVQKELEDGLKGPADYNSVIPDSYTKLLSRNLMKQLRENWRSGKINMAVAKATIRVPLLKLVDFEKSEAAAEVKKRAEDKAAAKKSFQDVESVEETELSEAEMDFEVVKILQKDTARRVEV